MKSLSLVIYIITINRSKLHSIINYIDFKLYLSYNIVFEKVNRLHELRRLRKV